MIDIFSYEVITQIVGVIASSFVVYAFTNKSDSRLKIFMMAGSIVFSIHFFLLGAYIGAIVHIIGLFRSWLSIKFHKSNIILMGFITIYVALSVITFESIRELLPLFAANNCNNSYV
jgi:hypothetical protein